MDLGSLEMSWASTAPRCEMFQRGHAPHRPQAPRVEPRDPNGFNGKIRIICIGKRLRRT